MHIYPCRTQPALAAPRITPSGAISPMTPAYSYLNHSVSYYTCGASVYPLPPGEGLILILWQVSKPQESSCTGPDQRSLQPNVTSQRPPKVDIREREQANKLFTYYSSSVELLNFFCWCNFHEFGVLQWIPFDGNAHSPLKFTSDFSICNALW